MYNKVLQPIGQQIGPVYKVICSENYYVEQTRGIKLDGAVCAQKSEHVPLCF